MIICRKKCNLYSKSQKYINTTREIYTCLHGGYINTSCRVAYDFVHIIILKMYQIYTNYTKTDNMKNTNILRKTNNIFDIKNTS